MKKYILLIIAIILIAPHFVMPEPKIIIDSDMTLEEALQGTKAPKDVVDSMVLLNVEYYGINGKLHKGQLVINKVVENDVKEAFKRIKEKKFPIQHAIPIVKYGWDDDKSMDDNNTSAFNYRFVARTTRLSNHSFGRAIDINTFWNPAVYADGSISPKGAKYQPGKPGVIAAGSFLVEFFKSRGWRWGGEWTSLQDYQHFDLP